MNGNNTGLLGSFGNAWKNLYVSSTSYLKYVSSTAIDAGLLTMSGNILPNANNTLDLGAYGSAWNNIFASSTAYFSEICWDNGQCQSRPAVLGTGINLYHFNTFTDVVAYEALFTYPATGTETDETCTADADVAGGYCDIDSYTTTSTNLSFIEIPTGSWTFDKYTYVSDSKLMQEALNPTGENWVAGHALPDSQTMILFLPPNPDHILDMRQRVPHETMHILLSQMTGSGYARLPFWLAEGLASLVELYPNPDYPILLDNAYNRNGLIPIGTLCDNFPRDASRCSASLRSIRLLHEFSIRKFRDRRSSALDRRIFERYGL